MNQRGITKQLRLARASAKKAMKDNSVGLYGRAMASEGFDGGYAQALSDVELALRGVYPNGSRHWPQPKERNK